MTELPQTTPTVSVPPPKKVTQKDLLDEVIRLQAKVDSLLSRGSDVPRPRLFVIYATVVQLWMALLFLLSPMELRTASADVFYKIFSHHHFIAIALILSSVFAIIGMFKKSSSFRFVWFLPQLLLLMLAASSALGHAIQGHYADGTVRPWQFIMQDQLAPIVAAFMYVFAVFGFEKGGYGGKD